VKLLLFSINLQCFNEKISNATVVFENFNIENSLKIAKLKIKNYLPFSYYCVPIQ